MPIRAMTPELTRPYYQQGLWRDETLCDLLDGHVRRTPGALAVADQHERLTYAEFAERAAAFAGWLVSREVSRRRVRVQGFNAGPRQEFLRPPLRFGSGAVDTCGILETSPGQSNHSSSS